MVGVCVEGESGRKDNVGYLIPVPGIFTKQQKRCTNIQKRTNLYVYTLFLWKNSDSSFYGGCKEEHVGPKPPYGLPSFWYFFLQHTNT